MEWYAHKKKYMKEIEYNGRSGVVEGKIAVERERERERERENEGCEMYVACAV